MVIMEVSEEQGVKEVWMEEGGITPKFITRLNSSERLRWQEILPSNREKPGAGPDSYRGGHS